MTGPEHYLEAERLLEGAEVTGSKYNLAAAQVHATLAHAAAVAEAGGIAHYVALVPDSKPSWHLVAMP